MIETIKNYHAKHGHTPTVSELARLEGITRVTVNRRLDELEEQGLIKRRERVDVGCYDLIG
jgi:DNA-binding GntR family transcriptional regulator